MEADLHPLQSVDPSILQSSSRARCGPRRVVVAFPSPFRWATTKNRDRRRRRAQHDHEAAGFFLIVLVVVVVLVLPGGKAIEHDDEHESDGAKTFDQHPQKFLLKPETPGSRFICNGLKPPNLAHRAKGVPILRKRTPCRRFLFQSAPDSHFNFHRESANSWRMRSIRRS